MLKFEFRNSTFKIILPARVAELVDAHVSGACSERSAGSSPVPGTKEILQVVQNERKSKIFFFFYIPILATYWPPFRENNFLVPPHLYRYLYTQCRFHIFALETTGNDYENDFICGNLL